VNRHELVNASQQTQRAAILNEAGTNCNQRIVLRADARATHQVVITAMDVLGRTALGA
jgi:biopolymer transport protein ExbD